MAVPPPARYSLKCSYVSSSTMALSGTTNSGCVLGVTRRRVPGCLNALLERVMDGDLDNTAEALSRAVREGLASTAEPAPKRSRRRRRSGGSAKESAPAAPEE